MNLSRKTYRISEIAESMGDAPFGTSIKNVDYVRSGALVIQGKNLQGRTCDWNDRRFVSLEKYHSLPRSHCFPGDLVFPKVGTIGKIGILTPFNNQKEYILSTNTMRLRPNETVAHRDYVYYYFSSPEVSNFIQVSNSKSVQPVFNFTSLRNFEIELPPLHEQKAIAQILSTLDDKIELNQRTNETLEAMAQALFKSWFVDFDPVRARAKGRQPYGMDGDTAMLFPEAFKDSELGEIPQGWTTGTVSDLCELAYGKGLPASKRIDGFYPVYGSAGMVGTHTEFLVKAPGIVIGRKGTIGKLNRVSKPFFPIDTTFYVVPKASEYSFEFLYFMLHGFDLESKNNDSAVPGLNRNEVHNLDAVIPPNKVLVRFNSAVNPMMATIDTLISESETLKALRDTLLPKLLSGEVQVKEAEKELAEVM